MKQTTLKVLTVAVLTSVLSSWSALAQTSLTIVSAADYNSAYGSVVPGSIVSMFAANIATGTFFAENLPLPTSLGGVSATISDGAGNTLPIQLIAVTPLQVNAVLPSAFYGNIVNLATSNGQQISGAISMDATAPSLFTADESGTWLPAAQVLTVHADGSQKFMSSVATCSDSLVWNGSTWSHCVPIPIDLGSSTDQVILELFGTGIRGVNSLPQNVQEVDVGVSCAKADPLSCNFSNGSSLNVLYAGAQGAGSPGSFAGLDQINVLLPQSLAGSGMVFLGVSVSDGFELNGSNTVTLAIQ
jgi:hypothetical protein